MRLREEMEMILDIGYYLKLLISCTLSATNCFIQLFSIGPCCGYTILKKIRLKN